MRTIKLVLFLSFVLLSGVQAQQVAVKTNLLYDATSTINLGCEVGLSKRFTADLSGNYNPWTFSGGKSIEHWMIQPEFRYWIHERFNGHFFGLHAQYGSMDIAGCPFGFGLKKDFTYDGLFVGGGLSYGYQLYLGPRWNVEFTAGVGYVYMDYRKATYPDTGNHLGDYYSNYFGVTKLGISIVYIIK